MDKTNMMAYIGGIVRIVTSVIGGYLAQKGLATEAETEGIAGAAVLVGTGLWSIWAKRKALLTPPPTTTAGKPASGGTAGLGLLLLCVCMSAGCANLTTSKINAAGKIAESYYNSANVAELWRMTSTNNTGRIVFENFNEFVMNTPVPPKTIIPREPSFWEGAWDTVKTLGPWAFFYGAVQSGAMGGGTHSTVNNYTTASP